MNPKPPIGQVLIEKYLPNRTPEQKEAARRNLLEFYKALLAPSFEKIHEERAREGLPYINYAKTFSDRLEGLPNRDHLFSSTNQPKKFDAPQGSCAHCHSCPHCG